jgi:hypothetical protein
MRNEVTQMSVMIARLLIVAGAFVSVGAADPQGFVIEVQAGVTDRQNTPLIVPLPARFIGDRFFQMQSSDSAQAVPVQVLVGDPARLVCIVNDLKARAVRRYQIRPTAEQRDPTSVTCEDDGKGLQLKIDSRPALRYNHAVIESPDGLAALYRRSGQIHPLTTPSGRVVSDDFPPDHAHQHGLFFAWVNTTFAGHHVDFWNQQEKTGTVKHVKSLTTASGAVFAQFSARLSHDDLSKQDSPSPALDEMITVRAYNVKDHYLIDYESRQTCAGTESLEINEYHYGGLGLRGNREWFDPTAKGNDLPDPARSGQSNFLTSEGKTRSNGNHTQPRWVDLFGLVGGQKAGVAVLDHPSNYRFPQPVRLHPNKPYLSFSPVVLGKFSIEPGKPYVSRYRFVLHDGAPNIKWLDRLWTDYAEPPRVRIVDDP